jgi:hypothetical protein
MSNYALAHGRCRWVALAFLVMTPVQTFAQESVDSRVRVLEETIQLLERRVASLEDQLRERSAPTSVAPGKEDWRKLRNGMPADEVESLLGSPSKVDSSKYTFMWYYESGGRVRFDTESRKVEGWTEP